MTVFLSALLQRPAPARLPPWILRGLREDMGMDCINSYNFAVCGETGNGKSSLLNALCGLREGDADASAVGHYGVGTTQARSYKPKNIPYAAVWDMPGTNHDGNPMATYFNDQRLAAFDVLLIVSDANRFTEIDGKLAKRAQRVGVPVIFVRTKADKDVDEEFKKAKRAGAEITETKAQIAARIKKSIKNAVIPELDKIGMSGNLFVVVSAFALSGDPADYPPMDETELLDRLEALALSRRK